MLQFLYYISYQIKLWNVSTTGDKCLSIVLVQVKGWIIIVYCPLVRVKVLTPECRDDVPHLDGSHGGELAQGKLHEVEGFAHNDEHDDVGDEERTSAILECREGETPHVTETHWHGDTWHEKLDGVRPLLPVQAIIVLRRSRTRVRMRHTCQNSSV